MSVHNAILTYLEAQLTNALITVPTAALGEGETDPAIAGLVTLGPLQGDPDPDQARISVTLARKRSGRDHRGIWGICNVGVVGRRDRRD